MSRRILLAALVAASAAPPEDNREVDAVGKSFARQAYVQGTC